MQNITDLRANDVKLNWGWRSVVAHESIEPNLPINSEPTEVEIVITPNYIRCVVTISAEPVTQNLDTDLPVLYIPHACTV